MGERSHQGNWNLNLKQFLTKYRELGSIGHFRVPKKSHFQSEAKYEAIDMKLIFNYDANKTHFHNKGFALSLVLQSEISWNSEMAYSVYRKTTAKA